VQAVLQGARSFERASWTLRIPGIEGQRLDMSCVDRTTNTGGNVDLCQVAAAHAPGGRLSRRDRAARLYSTDRDHRAGAATSKACGARERFSLTARA
jgi:hypothetical protein